KALVDWLRNLWQSLCGGRSAAVEAEAAGEAAEEPRPALCPFAAYRNPFVTGAQLSPEEVVRYSFEALEAFAQERELARGQDETPLEFAERLGAELPALEADVRRLAVLYARAAYARGRLSEESVLPLRQFWDKLDSASQPTVH